MTSQHVQCKLRRGDTITHSWLPEVFAEVGKVLDLREDDGTWTRGWVVVECWQQMESDEVLARRHGHEDFRAVTDPLHYRQRKAREGNDG